MAAAAARFTPDKTLFLVSSKSGTTAEVLALLSFFYDRARMTLGTGHAGSRFVAITDPGTPLEALARELRFRRVFPGQPDIGGRFSALSAFGLVPAALKGIDLDRLLAPARAMADACRVERAADNPGALLGAILGTAALTGMDKLTFLLPQRLRPLAGLARAAHRREHGEGGPGHRARRRGQARAGRKLRRRPAVRRDRIAGGTRPRSRAASRPKDQGRRSSASRSTIPTTWPGTSSCGSSPRPSRADSLGINPFDQPDVESTKKRTREVLASAGGGRRADAPADLPPFAAGLRVDRQDAAEPLAPP